MTSSTRRLSVRRRRDDGQVTDIVGTVVAMGQDVLVLQPEDAPEVVVPRQEVLAFREVPAQAVRPGSSPDRLRRMLSSHWPGLETARLGGWVLRAGGGFTRRANSALVGGDPGCSTSGAQDAVVAWYTERGLEPCLHLVGGADQDVAGWRPVGESAVLIADLRSLPMGDGPPQVAGVHPVVEDSETPSAAWLSLWRAGVGNDATARAVLTAAPARYITMSLGDDPIGCVRLVADRRWAHLSCLEVAPEARGRGAGRALTLAALDLARSDDSPASFAVVEVGMANERARGLYATLGMTEHHRYHYRVPERG